MGNLVNQHVRFIESGEFLTYPKPTGGNSLDRLIERKQMSTKTTFKRIALVAVAALGFGTVSAVSPANAAVTLTSISVGTIGATRTGVITTIPVTVNMSASGASDTITVAAKVTSAPTSGGSALVNSGVSVLSSTATETVSGASIITNASGNARLYFSSNAGQILSNAVYSDTTKGTLATDNYTSIGTASSTAGKIDAAATGKVPATSISKVIASAGTLSTTVYLSVKPDVSGTYTILLSASTTDGNNQYVAGDVSTSFSFTVGAAPTAIVMTSSGSHNISTTYGSLVKITSTDASGNPAAIKSDENITVSVSGGAIAKATLSTGNFSSAAPAAETSVSLTSSNFLNGVAFVNVLGSAAGTVTVTATGAGTLSSAVTNTINITAGKVATLSSGNTFKGAAGTAVTTGWYNTTASATTPVWTVKSSATSSTFEFAFTDPGATKYGTLSIVDKGALNGLVNTSGNTLNYDLYYSVADDDTYKTITLTHSALGSYSTTYAEFTVVDSGLPTATISVRGASSNSINGTVTVLPSNVRAATSSANTITALVKDQFGLAYTGKSVTVTVAGRNSARSSETLVTDSTGYVSTKITDSGTTGTVDTVSFTTVDSKVGTATITYGTTTVGTVSVAGGSKLETVAGSTKTTIKASDNGPEGSRVAITATVKDAAGNVLAGVPVTFTVDKGLIYKTATVDYATVYTGTDGTAVSYIFDWVNGNKQTVTATAGGVSGTDYLLWASNDGTTARVLTGTFANGVASYKVVDRFGNPVSGAVITLTRTGTGFFGTGKSTESVTTDSTGTADIQFTGAASTITATLASATYTQAYDKAGEIAATAVTAAVAGTTKGTGATLAPAGVGVVVLTTDGSNASVDAAQGAADAAAEATDAANAATDAANAAAEAADAATAAAQDAADAVAALSTQVSEMVSALKKQITALTNLVIKIQKKVKA